MRQKRSRKAITLKTHFPGSLSVIDARFINSQEGLAKLLAFIAVNN